ncbi:DHA2 family efflux MFS transporter permease subunit [Bacillus mexicanus]|uniref:DHA2 family efflux MFS transporter permease subunit n=1 Tax=Bacillus mexicanus TaxID=2834415 RepID=UPI003D1F7F1F
MPQMFLFIYVVLCFLIVGLVNTFILKNRKPPVNKKTSIKDADTKPAKEVKLGKILFVLMFGMFIAILNQTVINVLLPLIMTDFSISTSTAQWLTTGFMLVNGILIPLSAFLIARFGYRKLFIFGMISFTFGSLICALSGNFTLMMIGRCIQAIGAGVLMPLGTNVFMNAFPPEKRGTAMGTMGIAMILAPAIGPTLSGWIAENYQWNIMFYGMFILGIISLLFAFAWFHPKSERSVASFDLQSIIYSSLGFGGLLYGFSEAGNDGWDSPSVLITLILGIIFLIFFVIRQFKLKEPLLELRVFKFNIYTLTLVINAIVTMALFGGMLLLPVYLQSIRGFTPLQSGLLLLPGALIMGLMGPIAGKIFDKYGVRVLAITGLVITTYATYEFTKLTGQTPYKTILGIYMLRSFGMSLLMMPIMTAGLNQLPAKLIAHGNAATNTIRQVAGSIGTALLVTVMTNQTTNHLSNFTNNFSKTDSFLMNDLSQVGQSGMVSAYTEAAKTATINGINDAFLVATLFTVVALFLAFFLNKPKTQNKTETK